MKKKFILSLVLCLMLVGFSFSSPTPQETRCNLNYGYWAFGASQSGISQDDADVQATQAAIFACFNNGGYTGFAYVYSHGQYSNGAWWADAKSCCYQ